MDCSALADLISDYLDGNLDEGTKEELDFHFGDCPECVDFLKEVQQSIKWATECFEAESEMPDKVKSRLMAFAERLESGQAGHDHKH